MKQTFNYRKKFRLSFFYPMAAFVAAAILFKVTEYGIAFKNLTILTYPNTFYLSSFMAVLGATYFVYKYMDYKKASKNQQAITLTSSEISFPKGKNLVRVNYSDIDEICNQNEKDEDSEQVIIYTNSKMTSYELNSEHFDSIDEFYSFQKIMNNNCTNITNKN